MKKYFYLQLFLTITIAGAIQCTKQPTICTIPKKDRNSSQFFIAQTLISKNYTKTLQAFLDENRETPITDTDEYGHDLVHYAVGSNNEQALHDLIKNGYLKNRSDNFGATPLHYATQQTINPSILKELIKHHIIFPSDLKEQTPIYWAAAFNNYDAANILCEHFSHLIDKPDINGITALHRAIINKNNKIIELLLQYGANPHIKNNSTISPYELAKNSNETTIVSLFYNFNESNISPLQH